MSSAWMTIGIAARMLICANIPPKSTDICRCYWSIFILDRIHGSSFRILPAISDETILPEMPPCAQRPESHLTVSGLVTDAGDLGATEEDEMGINSCALQLLSIWGRLMTYLKSIRQGQLEDAWTANSTYQQIKSEMSRFETTFPESHRFKNLRFLERAAEDLSRNRDYGAPWLFTQCLFHTIHCTLNHPFLHVARIHGRQRRLRSPSFLQHGTDQAILHSTWVVHIISLCEMKGFAIFDPFIGHLVAVIATAWFFFRFSKDGPLAVKASEDFERLRRFVEKMAAEHSHLENTVKSSCVFRMSRMLIST